MWAEYVLASAIWILVIGILPTILHKTEKPDFLTGIITTSAIAGITTAYGALGLWASAIPSALITLGWLTLTVQRLLINRKAEQPLVQLPRWLTRKDF
ncbi:MAG: hypothetical protein NUV59_02605 [Patescibacteria group bacterium]|nr:hypothetical protein [Patescibacteria group bacterium]